MNIKGNIISRPDKSHQGHLFGVNITLRIVCYGVIVILLSNLNALVDSVLHPEIPCFDEEHLIVGGITALVTAVLFSLLTIITSLPLFYNFSFQNNVPTRWNWQQSGGWIPSA